MYEVDGKTILAISDEVQVHEITVAKWKAKDKWLKRGSEIKKVEEIRKNAYMEAAAKKGLTPESAIDKQIEGLKAKKEVVLGMDANGKPLIHSQDDHAIQHKHLQDYWKMSGIQTSGSAPNLNINNNEGGTLNIQVNIPALGED